MCDWRQIVRKFEILITNTSGSLFNEFKTIAVLTHNMNYLVAFSDLNVSQKIRDANIGKDNDSDWFI